MYDLGLIQCRQVPKLFYLKKKSDLVLMVAKIVDDLVNTGLGHYQTHFIQEFDRKFKFGSVDKGPGKLRFFGINVKQDDENSIHADEDEKLNALQDHLITRTCSRQTEEVLNEIEKKAFYSLNRSLG